MEVYIEVVAMDHENGVKKTLSKTIEVPGAVLGLHEMFTGNDTHKLVTAIAQACFMGATKELEAGRRNKSVMLNEQIERGAKIGGSSPSAGGGGEGAARDPLSEALGLDLIRRMGGQQQAAAAHRPVARATVAPQDGPGPVGFPKGR